MKINNLINLADTLDEKGLEKEAAVIDNFLKTAAPKIPMHKCGLKQESVDIHQELLEGYRKASAYYGKEFKKAMKSANDKESPNMGVLRDIMRNKVHNCNAVSLHEMYLDDLIDCKPYGLDRCKAAVDLLKEHYDGGHRALLQELPRVAKVSRNGWVLLNWCTDEKKMYLDVCDLHEIGVSATSIPVLALDMWEHAYVNDFGMDKEAYVEWFFSRLDWRKFVKRVKNCNRMK